MTDRFEESAAILAAHMARCVPTNLRSLVFASPLSTRSTDLSLFWHPVYRRKHRAALVVKALTDCLSDIAKGCLRIWPWFRRVGYLTYGVPFDRVLVIPAGCGRHVTGNRFETPYVETEPDDCVFVFGSLAQLGRGAVAYSWRTGADILVPLALLIRAGWRAWNRADIPPHHKAGLMLLWLSWVLSLRWLPLYALRTSLSDFVGAHDIRKIGCIHEMHPHARVAWDVAVHHAATGHTVQHAAFTDGKRWLFPHTAEREAGLACPAIFYVFNEQVRDLLQPHYPNTEFRMGCSRRYAQWKEQGDSEPDSPGCVLFVGALPRFDNDTLIIALRRIMNESAFVMPPRVRLHPSAGMSGALRRWLRDQERGSRLSLSRGVSLERDLRDAGLVVGVGSTVLLEALAMGRPVVQLRHPDFLVYLDLDSLRGTLHVDHANISGPVLSGAVHQAVDREDARRRLGLNAAVVTYDRLFDVARGGNAHRDSEAKQPVWQAPCVAIGTL